MGWKKSFSYLHIPAGTPGNIQVVTGPGVLHSVVFNTVGVTPLQLTMYDGLVANILSLTGFAMILPTATTSVVPSTALFDLRFAVGLIAQISGTTTMDLTIAYET